MSSKKLIAKAFNYAAKKHKDQRRKGVDAAPYINHLTDVANILAECDCDTTTIVAGILHDIVEDTDQHLTVQQRYDDLVKNFGKEIADIVMEVTDDKDLPKDVRKQKQIDNAAHKSDRAKQIKFGDKISNLQSILYGPPADWDEERRRDYFIWGKKVVDNCRGVNAKLEEKFDRVYAKGGAKFGITP